MRTSASKASRPARSEPRRGRSRRAHRAARLLPIAALFGLLAVCGAGPVRADWRADFMGALTAMDRRRWAEAEQLLERAVAENPAESRNLVSATIGGGMRNEPYLPYYHLGVARFRLGDNAGAVEAWEESIRQQKIQGFQGRFRDLETNIAAARTKVGPAAQRPDLLADAKRSAMAAIARATARRDALQEVTRDPFARGALAQDAGLSSQLDAFPGRLNALPSKVEQATSVATLRDVEAEAARLDEDLVGFRQRLTTLAGNRRSQWSQVESLAAEVESKRTAARDQLGALGRANRSRASALASAYDATLAADLRMPADPAAVADLNGLRQRLERSGADLDRLLDQLGEPVPDAPLRVPTPFQAPTRIQPGPAAATPSPPRPTEVPPRLPGPTEAPRGAVPNPLLRSGVTRYFESAYQDAVRILSTADFGPERFAGLQGQLFLAASKFQLYRLGAGSDRALLEQARDHVASVVSMEPGFTPAAKYFSPAFLAFFEEGRRPGRRN